MKRYVSLIIIILAVISFSGCLSSGRNTSAGSGNSLIELLSPGNDFGSVSSNLIKTIPKNMKYFDIIKRLGKTKDIGSGLHVAKYIVEGDKELLLSFSDPEEACPLSGPDMIKALSPLTKNNGMGSREANACIVPSRYKSVPIYDDSTDKQVGEAYSDFAISISDQQDGKAYFKIAVSDPSNLDKVTVKSFYIPINYLSKGYIEPFAVIEAISLDAVVLNENAPIYSSTDKPLASFYDKLGPVRYIQKTDRGYQHVIGLNLVYMKDKDVTVIKHKE